MAEGMLLLDYANNRRQTELHWVWNVAVTVVLCVEKSNQLRTSSLKFEIICVDMLAYPVQHSNKRAYKSTLLDSFSQ